MATPSVTHAKLTNTYFSTSTSMMHESMMNKSIIHETMIHIYDIDCNDDNDDDNDESN